MSEPVTVTIVLERGDILWGVLAYCALQFVVELGLQLIKQKRGE
jgi:hypothetical protein